jgi:hypothetical protein
MAAIATNPMMRFNKIASRGRCSTSIIPSSPAEAKQGGQGPTKNLTGGETF